MARFYVPEPRIEEGRVRIEGSEARHLRKVLRLRAGEKVTIFDGSCKDFEGTIVEVGTSSVVIRIETISSTERDSGLDITLAQSLLKGEKMDYLIQKATELGIREIIPFFSSRSVPLLEKSRRMERHHRWEKIVIEASKQCGRGMLPRVNPLQDYSDVLRSSPLDSLRLILWEREGTGLKEILKESGEKKRIFFIVGPEGGLSQEEVDESKEKGFIPVMLGKRILRAETASLCLLSILQYEWGDIG